MNTNNGTSSNSQRPTTPRNYGARWHRSDDDNYTGEDCDAARDYYRENGGYAVTDRDYQEDKAWDRECRRNGWR